MQESQSESFTYEMRKIDSLKAHPLNAEAFNDVDDDFKALMADIGAHGLQNEPHVLPNGDLILAGHRRIEACRQLGHTEIRCRIRHDLADASPGKIAAVLINDNLHRRHLSKLGIARAISAKARALCKGLGYRNARKDTIASLARMLGISERNARRYLRALKTPMAVQNALDGGALSLILADKVAGLSAEKQRRIAKKIDNGASAKAAVTAVLNEGRRKADSPAEPPLTIPQIVAGTKAWVSAVNKGNRISPKQRQALGHAFQALNGALEAQEKRVLVLARQAMGSMMKIRKRI